MNKETNRRLIEWSIDALVDWSVDYPIDWLNGWQIDWLNDWLIDKAVLSKLVCLIYLCSTASSGLNSLITVTLEDLVKKRMKDLTDYEATKLSKILGEFKYEAIELIRVTEYSCCMISRIHYFYTINSVAAFGDISTK